MTCEEMIYSNDYIDNLVNFLGAYEGNIDYFEDGCICPVIDKIAIYHSPKKENYLENLESIPYSFIPKLYGLMDASAMEAVGITEVQRKNGLNLDGKNVIVGIIDTGIDYQNPLFYKKVDGKKVSRIMAIWDQSEKRFGKSEDVIIETNENRYALNGPCFGTLYTRAQITQALNNEKPFDIVPTVDENGHGTFLAGISAGNEDIKNGFLGAAPDSDIAVVKLKGAKPYLREYFGVEDGIEAYQETDIIYAIRFLLRMAKTVNQPISILIGVGSSNGGHYGLTFLERYLDTILENVDIMVSVAAGNEGSERLHYKGAIKSGEVYEQAELNVSDGQKAVVLEIWGKRPTTFSLSIISPQGDMIERIPPRFGQEERYILPLARSVIYVAYQMVETYSGDELIFVRITNPTSGIWRFLVSADESVRREFDIWLPLRQFQKPNTYFLRPEPENTVTNPGNAKLTMTMTAYNHINDTVYVEAGRGYNSLNQIVPDLAAPGVMVKGPGRNDSYITKSGTSVAAAVSAGAMALFLQWSRENPELGYLYAGQIQSLFLKNAGRSMDVSFPNPILGYGYMDIEKVFEDFRVLG